MLKIAVIGSGASALASIEGALSVEKDISITLIDPWIKLPTGVTADMSTKPRQIAKKSRFGSLAMYEYPKNLIQFSANLHIPLSGTIGGLTSVWGANSIIPSADVLSEYLHDGAGDSVKWVNHFCNLSKLSELSDDEDFFISSRFKKIMMNYKPNSNLLLDAATLAFEVSRCSKNGGCLGGCSTNAIFTAETRIIELVENGVITLRAGFADRVTHDENSKFSVFLVGEKDNMNNTENYDKVFVACGAIGTCSLLQRSGLIPTEIQLSDTQVFYVPFFIRHKGSPWKPSFELSQLFLRKSQSLHISIYEYSEQFLDRARLLIGPLVRLVPMRIWQHVVAGIGFIDSENSGRLNLKYIKGKTEVTEIQNRKAKKAVTLQLRSISKELTKAGILRIPLLTQIGNIGSSYHIGAAAEAGAALIGTTGKLQNNESLELYIVDSASLYSLPIGPITTTVMALSYGRTRFVLSN